MAGSFFFYDLETSGFSPRSARVMQFAGQRTDMDLQPIGEPINVLIKLTPDVLPQPDAILITGITPQQTLTEGLTEAEFLKLFYQEVVQSDTIFTGFNSVRFDDEFMRFLHYRNFYDAYEWQWKDGCSRWDILDMVRMTRALRPDGIQWPFAPDGKPANRLEFLTKVNKLDHSHAHDALNDVLATIAVAKLVREKQPELFKHLLETRKKDAVRQIVDSGQPFMYTSGRYSSVYLHTTTTVLLGRHAQQDYALVYDLRYDPAPFLAMTVDELIELWRYKKDRASDPAAVRLPVKTLKYNRCPAIVPGVVKDPAILERLHLSREAIATNLALLRKNAAAFTDKLFKATAKMDAEREQAQLAMIDNQLTVDERLYDGFINKRDAEVMRAVRAAQPAELSNFATDFTDSRLKSLLPLYKARNYPASLDTEERAAWEAFCHQRLFTGDAGNRDNSPLATYFARLEELASGTVTDKIAGKSTPKPAAKLTVQQRYLLEELQLYGQSIIPTDYTD